MKKRALSFLMAVLMMLCMLTNAFAYNVYTVPEGTVVLEEVPVEYEVLVIPDSVLIISDGPQRYDNSSPLKYLSLGNGVQYIGSNSFSGTMISTVTIPNSVTEIGYQAFPSVEKAIIKKAAAKSLCSKGVPLGSIFPNATTIVIEADSTYFEYEELEYIKRFLYEGQIAYELKSIIFNDVSFPENYLSEGTIKISESAYEGCYFESLRIPDSVQEIGSRAFYNASISGLYLGEGVSVIGENAFAGSYSQSNFNSVTIPNSVTEIGGNAFPSVKTVTFEASSAIRLFSNSSFTLGVAFPDAETVYIKTALANVELERILTCDSVGTIVFADGNVWQRGKLFLPTGENAIRDYAYQGMSAEKIVIPDDIITIGDGAFKNVLNGDSGIPLSLGDNVSNIGNYAFQNSGVSSVVFGSAPVCIGESAFANTKITSVKIPANVISLGSGAFDSETLEAVTLDASLFNGALSNKPIIEVFGAVNVIVIDGEITGIPEGAFSGTGASVISYSDNVVSIGSHAFAGCGITDARIGAKVMSIGEYVYQNTQITSLNIPDSVRTVGNGAFRNCDRLHYAYVGSGLTVIAPEMFSGCNNLELVKLPESITAIGSYAFSDCESLSDIKIPSGVTEIGSYAFQNCMNLKEIVIPKGVKTIRTGAFMNCTGLENIVIPKSVETIEAGAFEGCTGLEDVVVSLGVSEIQASAFKGCNALDTVVIPETVEAIGDGAFDNCTNITLAGSSDTAVEAYANQNNITFYPVNAYPCAGTKFDFDNGVIYTTNTNSSLSEIIENGSGVVVGHSDRFCGTGSIVTVIKGDEVKEYVLVVDGDVDGDSICDVLDVACTERFLSQLGNEPTKAQLYAICGKDVDEVTENEFSVIVNKSLR